MNAALHRVVPSVDERNVAHSASGGGRDWSGLERLREVPECAFHTKTGHSFAEPQSSPGHPTFRQSRQRRSFGLSQRFHRNGRVKDIAPMYVLCPGDDGRSFMPPFMTKQ